MNKTLRAVRQFAALALCACLLAGCARVSPGSAAPSASASVPGPAAAFSAAQLPDEPLPPIEEETLDELEAFLNDSKVLSWLDPDSLKDIYAGEAPSSGPRGAVSLVLLAHARSHQVPIPTTEDGIPYFAIGEFDAASRELFGPSYSYDFAALAAEIADPVPEGSLCVMSGYGLNVSLILIDRGSVSFEQGNYSVWINSYGFPMGDYSADRVRKKLVFRLNAACEYSPIQLISITDAPSASAFGPVSSGDAQDPDGPQALIEPAVWDKIETFLNNDQPFALLKPGALEQIEAGGTPEGAYKLTAHTIISYIETNRLPADQLDGGFYYFPIEDFVTASKELFGPSCSCDFAAIAAERADPIPEGMLYAGVGYNMEMHLYLIDRNTVTLEQGVYSVWLDDYAFYPAGNFLSDTVELTRRRLLFRLNGEYRYSPIQLAGCQTAPADAAPAQGG